MPAHVLLHLEPSCPERIFAYSLSGVQFRLCEGPAEQPENLPSASRWFRIKTSRPMEPALPGCRRARRTV